MESIWKKTAELPEFHTLTKDIRTKILIKRYKDLGWLIDCDMKEVDSYVFDRMDAEKLKREAAAAIFNPSRSILKPQLAINMWEAMKGILKPRVKNRCTHMGCVLHWNAKEQTFECPCHGSCFDASGEVLENPARHKLENKSGVFLKIQVDN